MYRVEIIPSAQKELLKIPKNDQLKILDKIELLAEFPRENGGKKLRGSKNNYRIRQGNYRIIYTIDDDVLFVEVIRIKHRKEVYL